MKGSSIEYKFMNTPTGKLIVISLPLDRLFHNVLFFYFSYCLKKMGKASNDDKKAEEQLKMAGIKIGKDGNKYKCRFKFPKKVVGYEHEFEETTRGTDMIVNSRRNPTIAPKGAGFQVMDENPNKLELKMLRNHPAVNNHIPEITQIQISNTDWTVVRTQEQAEEYLTKYMGKPGEASKDHERAVKSAISKKNESAPAKSAIQSMFMEMCNMDIPKEAAALELLKNRKYMNFSCPMRHISLGHDKVLHLEKGGEEMAISSEKTMADKYFSRHEDPNFERLCTEYKNNPEEYFRKLKKYQPDWKCPVEPEKITLYWYAAFFNANWTMSTKMHCPVFSPSHKKVPNKFSNPEGFERWAKMTMLIYTPGARPETIMDGFDNVSDAMDHFVRESGHCPNLEKKAYEKACINRAERGLQEEADDELEDEEEEFQEPELFPSSIEGTYKLLNFK